MDMRKFHSRGIFHGCPILVVAAEKTIGFFGTGYNDYHGYYLGSQGTDTTTVDTIMRSGQIAHLKKTCALGLNPL